MDVYWWLSALTEYLFCPACWIILPHPWGKLIKTQLFGKQHFKGACEHFLFLILPRICSQKIKDSPSRLKNSSLFMVSPPRSQEKRWLTLPHFPLILQFWDTAGQNIEKRYTDALKLKPMFQAIYSRNQIRILSFESRAQCPISQVRHSGQTTLIGRLCCDVICS